LWRTTEVNKKSAGEIGGYSGLVALYQRFQNKEIASNRGELETDSPNP
jgi:hypothetical protein